MRYEDFQAMVNRMATEVPPEFLDGIEAIDVTTTTVPHPLRRDVWTLGECIPRLMPSDGPAQIRSIVALHWGSFQALARITPGFDWRHEAWETLTHELRHHLEWRASVPALEALDDAVEANYARSDGESFPPLFYLDGERVADDVTRVEEDVFYDVPLSRDEWKAAGGSLRRLTWHGAEWLVTVPDEVADVHFLVLEELEPEPPGEVVMVLRRRPGTRDIWRRTVVRSDYVSVRPVPGP